jgi:hypothetical protein
MKMKEENMTHKDLGLTEEILKELAKTKSGYEIGRMYNVSGECILYYMKKFEIKPLTTNEILKNKGYIAVREFCNEMKISEHKMYKLLKKEGEAGKEHTFDYYKELMERSIKIPENTMTLEEIGDLIGKGKNGVMNWIENKEIKSVGKFDRCERYKKEDVMKKYEEENIEFDDFCGE